MLLQNNKQKRVLVAEDEKSLRETLKINLELEGFEVIDAKNGQEVLEIFKNSRIDLVILDVMMPEMDGFSVCKAIRMENNHTPVLFLTAKSLSSDKIEGLKIGGDDYMTKPFDLEEFLLRVKILLKRTSNYVSDKPTDKFQFDNFWVDFSSFEVFGLFGLSKLTNKEVKLLRLLIERKNQVVSRNEILELVWGYDTFPSSRTVDNFILTLRKHFEKDPKNPTYFLSIRGVGYMFSDK